MSIESYIINDMEICQVTDKIGDLKEKFNELTYSHLPVGKEDVYLGCISENDVRCFDAEKTISDYQYALEGFYARLSDNWLETLETGYTWRKYSGSFSRSQSCRRLNR